MYATALSFTGFGVDLMAMVNLMFTLTDTTVSSNPSSSGVASETTGNAAAGAFTASDFIGPVLTAAVFTGLVALYQHYLSGKREFNQQVFNFQVKQVNEFYGPVLLLLAEDHTLISTVREACGITEGKDWYMVDHLEELSENTQLWPVVERIGKVNLEITKILKTKSGLTLNSSLPESYKDFISHAHFIHRSVQEKRMLADVGIKFFPKQFETNIQQEHENLVNNLKKSFKQGK